MDNISEEANTSEMKPDQIHEEFGKALEDSDKPFIIILKGGDNDLDDETFLFGVGGPA
tara:strand:- start:1512 stop:1685 length:174 start_codon:yes stop_codon:yes gene_type:complete